MGNVLEGLGMEKKMQSLKYEEKKKTDQDANM